MPRQRSGRPLKRAIEESMLLQDIFLDCSLRKEYFSAIRNLQFGDGGSRDAAIGITGLQYVLFLDYLVALHNVVCERGKNAASLPKIVERLKDKEIIDTLHSRWSDPTHLNLEALDDDTDQKELSEMVARRKLDDLEAERTEIIENWDNIQRSARYQAINDARNKVIAHRQIARDGSGARLYSLREFGVRADEAVSLCDEVEPIIIRLPVLLHGQFRPLKSERPIQRRMASLVAKRLNGI